MALSVGTRLGAYEVTGMLGAGGMGEVYRARDTKLHRDVALKVISPSFTSDPERVARFEREAQLLASLNHPHIAAIYGFEEGPAEAGHHVRALVLELVDGPTLADRIAQGPLPLDEALTIARQIAEALEAAHDKGIIHRDLKPANVKLTPDGQVKVLDFGLAKLTDPPATGSVADAGALSMSPTLTSPALMTGVGVILGTAAYMSPEQARGKPVDARADVWAFGCVCFEMLTGTRAFPGDDVTQTIAAVIRAEPDWTLLPPDLPAAVRVFLERAVEKDPRQRVQHIGDLRLALAGAFDLAAAGTPAAASRAWLRALAVAAVLLAAGLGFAGAVVMRRESPAIVTPMRFAIDVPVIFGGAATVAFSPDGRTIAFSALGRDAVRTLWLRDLASTELRELPLVRTFGSLAWSPDAQQLAFTANGGLHTVDVSSGAVRTVLASTPETASGMRWVGSDIVFPVNGPDGASLMAVSPAGGPPRTLMNAGSGRFLHLSDAAIDAFLYVWEEGDRRQVCVAETNGTRRGCLPLDATTVSYANGHLVYGMGSSVFAQPFDLTRVATTGVATLVAADVALSGNRQWWAVSSASAGRDVLAYFSARGERSRLTWLDRAGRAIANVSEPAAAASFGLSDDGRFVISTQTEGGTNSAHLLDLERGTTTRAVGPAGAPRDIVWAPDNRRVAYHTGPGRIVEQPAFGGRERVLYESPDILGLEDWSGDGQFLAVLQRADRDRAMVLVPAGGGAPTVVATGPFVYDEFRFSPDGRWLAYNSDESGRQEVYLAPLPSTGERWPVSTGGGVQPRWNPNGRELFYLALDGTLMSVSVAGGTPPATGRPMPLFKAPFMPTFNLDHFEVAPGASRFLVRLPETGSDGARLDIVVSWPSLLSTPATAP